MTLEKLGDSDFLETFGNSPINRILDFLVSFNKFDYSMSDLSQKAGVSYSTLKELLPSLEKKKIIVKTRVSGKSNMYKLNSDSPSIKQFMKFYWSLVQIDEEVVLKAN